MIVGPVVCLLYDPLEIFPEGPVVLRPLLVGLQWGLGGGPGPAWSPGPDRVLGSTLFCNIIL